MVYVFEPSGSLKGFEVRPTGKYESVDTSESQIASPLFGLTILAKALPWPTLTERLIIK